MTLRSLSYFLEHARPKDVLEVELTSGKPFVDFSVSELKDTDALIDTDTGEVYCIGGVVVEGYKYPVVWLLCTTCVEKYPLRFLRFIRKYLAEQLKEHEILWNIVWLGNDLHVKWLKKWCHARFQDKVTIKNNPFQIFSIGKEVKL